ncbi:MAG: Rap1a/Tai family immunity protein [Rhodospirillales bacterium]
MVALLAWPLAARAVTPDNFLIKTASDLVQLCSADAADPMRVAAIHFCEGFVVGAYQYHQAEHGASQVMDPVCYPANGPSRDQAIQMYVDWAQKNPQFLGERPVDSLFRFATATWPCGK